MKKFYAFCLLLFSITMYAQPTIGEPTDLVACDLNGQGFATFDLSSNNPSVLGSLNPADYTVSYHFDQGTLEAGLALPNVYLNEVPFEQVIYVKVTENMDTDNYAMATFSLIANPAPTLAEYEYLVAYDDNNDGIATFDLTTIEPVVLEPLEEPLLYNISYYTTYADASAGTGAIASPQAYVSSGSTIYYRVQNDTTGCYTIGSTELVVLPEGYETEEPEGETIQTFIEGQTLEDLEVEGENVQWYENETETVPLPLTTVLVNGTTYYASQTVYNIESTNRLAVTVNLVLSVADNQLTSLSYYPNPVKDVFTISNTNPIEAVSVVNTLGQQVVSKTINNTNATVDFSLLNSGIYFVQLSSGGSQKTIKVVKE
ncbi:T9SS type A sorting domain-containing protein [Flavobacterium subsaxonicum]|nr:T9SS type A sorting domain-containing protein [Flavobacterium subsaxonicum]